jgi:large subunit ribosomal protein L10
MVATYTRLLEKSDGLVITEYRGMSVATMTDIRKVLRESKGSYVVTQNRLLKIALNNLGMPVPDKLLKGPTAIGFSNGDLPAVVKTLLEKQKTNELLVLKGAVIGQQILGAQDLQTLADLPSLDVLRAQLLGLLVAPAQNLVNVLNAPVQNLVNVLEAGSNTLADVLAAYAAKSDAA